MLAQTAKSRIEITNARVNAFNFGLRLMNAAPSQLTRAWKKMALVSIMDASHYVLAFRALTNQTTRQTVKVRHARQMLRAARKLFIKKQRDDVGQHQRH